MGVGYVGIPYPPNAQLPVVSGFKTKVFTATFVGIGATGQYDAVGTLQKISGWADYPGGSAVLRKLRITCDNNAIAPQFEVHFFKASDATIAADNVAWTELDADYLKRAGYIIMPALAKASGGGIINFVRAQHDDLGQSLDFQITCDTGVSDVWVALKLITAGIVFAGAPGNTIRLIGELQQS